MYKVAIKTLLPIFRKIGSSLVTLLLICALISACERNTDPSPSQTIPASPTKDKSPTEPKFDPFVPQAVATTDEPIAVQASVTGLAFWNHPNVTFNGLIIAATSNGIYTQTPEGKNALPELTADIGPVNGQGISLTYFPATPINASATDVDEEKFAKGIFTIFDKDNQAFRFFSISNASRKIRENLVSIPYKDNLTDFCLTIDSLNESLRLYILSDVAVKIFSISTTPSNGYSVEELDDETRSEKLISCAVDPLTHEVFTLSSTGKIHKPFVSADSVQIPVSNPADFQIAYETPHIADSLQQPRRRFIVLDRDNALVHMLEGESEGINLLGILELTDFDDIKGVKMAETMAFGSGNFGGLYRFGAIALVAIIQENEEAQFAVRLTPYIAVARALAFTTTGTVNPRQHIQDGETKNDQGPEFEFDLNKFQPVKPQ